jgi:hypothetical protein
VTMQTCVDGGTSGPVTLDVSSSKQTSKIVKIMYFKEHTETFVGHLDNFLRELRDMVNCGKFLDNWVVGMEDLAGEMDMVLTAEAVGTVS